MFQLGECLSNTQEALGLIPNSMYKLSVMTHACYSQHLGAGGGRIRNLKLSWLQIELDTSLQSRVRKAILKIHLKSLLTGF